MIGQFDRRDFLAAAAVVASAPYARAAHADNASGSPLRLGQEQSFSWEILKQRARELAAQPYRPPQRVAPEIISKINYQSWGEIKFDTAHALYAEGPNRFPITFFHLGMFFPKSVEMNVVEGDRARQIIYDQSYFDMPADSIARNLPQGIGFAGLRIQEAKDNNELNWKRNDWVAFLGAAYFRSIGELHQYGLSARGVALDPAVAGKAEEFPDFTRFYIGPESGDTVILHALMEGASIVGACRFFMTRGKGVLMDIDQSLHLRADIARFGLTPLTSMYWFSETVKKTGADWRPEVHDSDGLAMWAGTGERLWRPLNNPPRVIASAFSDENPRGFGLLQRDRNFDHYQDGVFYDRRPSLWVEPKGSWGKGTVQLIEIPTDDEIHDNIVAMWVPEKPASAGSEFDLSFRLYWLADEPFPTPLARCVATRLGNGGQPGQPRPQGVRKFMVEFLGGPLADLPFGKKPEPVLWASRGTFSYVFTEPVPDEVAGHWRAQFDLTIEGADPVEMRLFLRLDDQVLSETWLYQYHPF
jgi:periplasmic glucans biosynthesis protein